MDALLSSVYRQFSDNDAPPAITSMSFSNIYFDSRASSYSPAFSNAIMSSDIWPVLTYTPPSTPSGSYKKELRMRFYTSNWNVSTTQPTYVRIKLVQDSLGYLWYTYDTNRTTSYQTITNTYNAAMTENSLNKLSNITLQPFSGSNSASSYAAWYMHGTIEVRYVFTPNFSI